MKTKRENWRTNEWITNKRERKKKEKINTKEERNMVKDKRNGTCKDKKKEILKQGIEM